jgi:hypothetical protein
MDLPNMQSQWIIKKHKYGLWCLSERNLLVFEKTKHKKNMHKKSLHLPNALKNLN